MKIQKNKILGGGGVNRTLSTSNNNNNKNTINLGTKINSATKLLICLNIGFLLMCAMFLCMTISMLSDSKTATGTVTFALTSSPELKMDVNFVVKGTEHTTCLGNNQDAKVTSESDVLKVNITQTSSVKIIATFDENTIKITDGFELKTNNNILFNKTITENVAIFTSQSDVIQGDYIILDKLLNAIYPTKEVINQSYSVEITSQAGNSAPATATLSGKYKNVITQYDVNFSIQNADYGEISGTGIFSDFDKNSTNNYKVPHGTTTSIVGNTITFTDPYGNELGSLTATVSQPDMYGFSWGANSVITGGTTITATFEKTIQEFVVSVNYIDLNGYNNYILEVYYLDEEGNQDGDDILSGPYKSSFKAIAGKKIKMVIGRTEGEITTNDLGSFEKTLGTSSFYHMDIWEITFTMTNKDVTFNITGEFGIAA